MCESESARVCVWLREGCYVASLDSPLTITFRYNGTSHIWLVVNLTQNLVKGHTLVLFTILRHEESVGKKIVPEVTQTGRTDSMSRSCFLGFLKFEIFSEVYKNINDNCF